MSNASFRPQKCSAIQGQLSSPSLGLNTVDPLSKMSSDFGISIQNFQCTPEGLSIRQGYRIVASAIPAAVTSLLPYHGKNPTTNRLFAVAGGSIFDATSGGPVGTAVVTGLAASAPYWQYAAQSSSTGVNTYMFAVNGVDFPRMYDGISWTTCSQVSSASAPGQFSNVDNNDASVNAQGFVDVLLHQQRLWFVEANSTKAYYLPIAAAGGQLNAFDFGPFFPTGGSLHKLASWTLNLSGAQGNQTVLVAMSDKGDVVIYSGNDPDTSTTFAMSGYFKIGSPIGRRCTMPYEGDLLVLTQDGLYPMSKYDVNGRADRSDALTYRISPTISNLVSSYSNTPGFEVAMYPGQDVMLLNVPQSLQTNNFQFCYNTQTKGWTQFTGWPAQCFALFNDNLYFGGTNSVCQAFVGYQDGASLAGNGGDNIVATAMQAFATFNDQVGQPGMKCITQIRPYFVSGDAAPQISVGINTDFNITPITGSATIGQSSGAVWDSATWDSGATWVGSLSTNAQWTGVSCWPANYFAVVLSVSAATDTLWSATDFLITAGGLFG